LEDDRRSQRTGGRVNRKGMDHVGVLVFSAAAIYAALAIMIGVVPGIVLSKSPPSPGIAPLNAAQARGRDVYVGEGCSYCHTQFVRPLAQDRVWGRASVAGDYAYSTPQLLGTERTGPDLSNIGARQPSNVWQSIHLYEPRALVNGSIMPAYPWLFVLKDKADPGDVVVNVPPAYAPPGKVVVATVDEQDLVAYLTSLKQTALPSPAP
jgi:cytochrome c oxidase cbb3-type subunit II